MDLRQPPARPDSAPSCGVLPKAPTFAKMSRKGSAVRSVGYFYSVGSCHTSNAGLLYVCIGCTMRVG